MIYTLAQYMHCSSEGTYIIPCTTTADMVIFDIDKHGDLVERALGKSTKTGKYGYLTNYYDPVINEFVYNEWASEEYIVK